MNRHRLAPLKALVPMTIRPLAHRLHRRYEFERALKQFRKELINPSLYEDLFERLTYGWGNEGWSAGAEFTRALLCQAVQPNQTILECGSGLTTMLMALISIGAGTSIVSLEHSADWVASMTQMLERHAPGHNVRLLHAPLADYGDFTWYAVPRDEIDGDRFSCVVCDGPPNDTPGGRYGLLPVMREYLLPQCTILLDDIEREQEQMVVRAWEDEFGIGGVVLGAGRPFARLQFAAPGKS